MGYIDSNIRAGCLVAATLVLLVTIEKQIFDFLGYMWAPMLGNFLNIVFTIFLCFGCYHRRPWFLIVYLFWCLSLWMPWNAFLICYYSQVGSLRLTQDLLSFGTRSFSWWLANGYGCEPEYFTNSTLFLDDVDLMFPIKPSRVTGCFMEYHLVEVMQSAIQLSVTVICCLLCAFHLHVMLTRMSGGNGGGQNNFSGKNSNHGGGSIYSIEYSPRHTDSNTNDTTALYSNIDTNRAVQMTPRRVKRRSYTRSSARSARSHRANNKRSTLNSLPGGSLRLKGTNPVTRLMEADSRPPFRSINDSSTSNDENGASAVRQTNSNPIGAAATTQQQQQQQLDSMQLPGYGQINPAYESSRPNSVYSNGAASQARPPSALTSYSNFHGQRKAAANINHNMFTQETILQQQQQQQQPQQQQNQPNAADISFEDLPPPPPPLESAKQDNENNTNNNSAVPQMPVPQQRGSSGRFRHHNEYVNMPVVPQQQQQENNFNAATLRADNHLLKNNPTVVEPPYQNTSPQHPQPQQQQQQQQQQIPPPLPQRSLVNGHHQSINNHLSNVNNHHNVTSNSNNITTSEDDYGFSQQNYSRFNPSTRLLQQQQQQQQHQHGGNCKCYRCQRKLTAI